MSNIQFVGQIWPPEESNPASEIIWKRKSLIILRKKHIQIFYGYDKFIFYFLAKLVVYIIAHFKTEVVIT